MEDKEMNDTQSGQPHQQTDAASGAPISEGTPLKDTEETPLYVKQEVHEPIMGIGPGTPLNDPEDNPSAEPENKPTPPEETAAVQPEPETSTPVTAAAEEITATAPEPSGDEPGEEEDFAAELEQSFNNQPETGEIVQGTIIRIDDESVIVDVGYKSEGMISKSEFLNAQGQFVSKVGDVVDVLLEKKENRDGLLVLSKKKVDRRLGWNKAKVALANGSNLEGLIYERCKGGFMVDLGGVSAFLPGSQVDVKQSGQPEAYLGKRYAFKVIKMNRQRGNIVVSRRNLLLEEQDKKRSEVMAKLSPGRLVHGVVKNITNYGAFVDIGGVDALLHVNDMSWAKVTNPRNVVSVGDELEVLILSIDQENGRIALGLKQKGEDPWKEVEKKYPVDSIIEGQVVSLTEFGAFLRIEEGLEGLLPISEMSWTKRLRHPKDLVKAGDSVRVKVLAVNGAAKKITLGLKQTEPEPFSVYTEHVKIGDVVSGEVKSLPDFGAFVELAEGVTGLIHISDLSWDNRIKKSSEVLKSGDQVQVKILDIQPGKKKIALGLKQLNDDPWDSIAKSYPVGKAVTGTVVRNTKFGVFVQLEPGVEGLIHISQLEKEKGKSEPAMPAVGEEIKSKVIKVNKAEHKIGLSIRELMHDQEKAEMEKYLSPDSKPSFSLGESLGDKMQELLKKVNSNQ